MPRHVVLVTVNLKLMLESETRLCGIATSTLVAPVQLKTTFPEYVPGSADAASLTYTAVDVIAPPVPTVTVLLNVLLSVLTSNPAGGVTKIPADRLVPDTLKLVDDEAVPLTVLRADKLPVAMIAGGEGCTVIW